MFHTGNKLNVMPKSEKLPLSPMLVQYLVGLCTLRWDTRAVNVKVTLGDMVADEASGTRRDVDVTVTVDTEDGLLAFKGYEVKHWSSALDVSDVEGLIMKFNDMPSVTHRAIVSSSGFSQAAISKAEYHSVDLYTFRPWERPIAEQFPHLANMTGPPNVHIRSFPINLVWPIEHQWYWLVAPDAPAFNIPRDGKLFDAEGAEHPVFPTFDALATAMVLRSTGILIRVKPIQDMVAPLLEAFLDQKPIPDEPHWPHAHTLDIDSEAIYLRASDEKLYRIQTFTLGGRLKWERLPVIYSVLEKVPTGEAFAGAVIAPSDVEGRMSVMIFPATRREVTFREVELETKHLNSIRDLKVAIGQT